jgi:hypothetical protein
MHSEHGGMRRELNRCPTSHLGVVHPPFFVQWFYAQFDQQTLEAAFHVLSEYKGNWSSVFDIAAYSSVHQGWYADDDTGAITGDKKVGTLFIYRI